MRVDAVVFDSDRGQRLDEIRQRLRGFKACIVSTHSHNVTSHRFSRLRLHELNDDAEAFMRAKGYHESVASGAKLLCDREGKPIVEDMRVTIEHAPCEKYRIILWPVRSWIRTCDQDVYRYRLGMQQLAANLGLMVDDACTGVSRLYFDARHKPGSSPVVVHMEGDAVDPWTNVEIPQQMARHAAKGNAKTSDPSGSGESQPVGQHATKGTAPPRKGGIIGAFNEAYSIVEAMEKFIPGVYEAASPGRFRYYAQSNKDGAEILDAGHTLRVYSNTDTLREHCERPNSGFGFANSFDMVRVHEFGDLDTREDMEKPVQDRPSFKAMFQLALDDERVRELCYSGAFDEVEGMDPGERQVGEPIDFLTETSAAPLPRGALPAVVEDYAFDQAELMGVDPAGIALGCLVACAAAIDDKFKVQPKRFDDGWTESARLWGVVVGDPSTKKTPALGAAIKCVEDLDRELWEQDRKKLEVYGVKVKAHEKQMKAFQEKIGKIEISFDDDEWETAPPPPVKPKMRRTIVKDITVEKLADILTDNERGILAFHDELSGFFGAMDAYKSPGVNKDRASLLTAYNGGPHSVDRVGRGSISIPNWSVCVLGGIQPALMKKIAGKIDDDGLLQRFMVVIARTCSRGANRVPDKDARARWNTLVRDLYAMHPPDAPFILDSEADATREGIDSFSHDMLHGDLGSTSLNAHLGKWSGLFARLLLTFHIVEHVAAGKPPAGTIGGATARRVEMLMKSFLASHALHFYLNMLGDGERYEHMKKVALLILARGWEKVTLRDLQRNYRPFKKKEAMAEIQGVMSALADHGWVCFPHSPGDAKEWRVNPAVHEKFERWAAEERERRAGVRAHMETLKTSPQVEGENSE
jgi:hypothetical protein